MTAPRANRLFGFGLGYSAGVLAHSLGARGWQVAGTCREEERAGALAAAGVEAHLFGRHQPLDAAGLAALAGATHVLSSVPPDATGDPVIDLHGPDIAGVEGLAWAGYLSTTGVYGDRAGDWVDEGSERRPSGVRGRRRVAAEDAWQALWREHGVAVHIFRLAGIYGPGRSVLDQLRAGTAQRIVKPGQVFSRIHVDDIAAVLMASMARPAPGAIYNVCDDRPAPPAEVIVFAAGLLGLEAPAAVPFAEAELSEAARSFYADNKRVRNTRLRRQLGVRLEYADYEAGLRAILAAGG